MSTTNDIPLSVISADPSSQQSTSDNQKQKNGYSSNSSNRISGLDACDYTDGCKLCLYLSKCFYDCFKFIGNIKGSARETI